MFKISKQSNKSSARLGVLTTSHGKIESPFFMPVATRGVLKHLSAAELEKLKPQILLSNTYHLMLRPGSGFVARQGGLHKFMDWPGPILTDSGGFQVFSLSGTKRRGGEPLVKLDANGVRFKSYLDGQEHYLTPEESYRIQKQLGVDIAVCLDECVALPAGRDRVGQAVDTTTAWATKAKAAHNKARGAKPLLFAVVQGGTDKEERLRGLRELTEIGFDGYNIGGLAVGETSQEMYRVLDYLCPAMPADKPRYLMGVGYPENIVEAVRRGVDMFDCVIPAREGRHGRIFDWRLAIADLSKPGKNFYIKYDVTKAKYKNTKKPINQNSVFSELRGYSLAYLHYLFKIKEPLAERLATLNNLEFYLDLMKLIRYAIKSGKL